MLAKGGDRPYPTHLENSEVTGVLGSHECPAECACDVWWGELQGAPEIGVLFLLNSSVTHPILTLKVLRYLEKVHQKLRRLIVQLI